MDIERSGEDDGRDGERALVRSELQDELDTLQGTVGRTAGAGVVITALFLVAGVFMEQSGTRWFLAGMWVLIIARLTAMHRTARRSLMEKHAELERLDNPAQESQLPPPKP